VKAVPFVAAHNAYHFGRIVLFGRSVTDIPVAEFCGAPFGLIRFRLTHPAVGKGILGDSDLGSLRLIHPTHICAALRS
jgi:hypothetical protein